MSTTYTGVPGNVSLGAAVTESLPQDGVETLGVASVNTPLQKLADYIEALRLGLTSSFLETFDAATFPPTATNKWATPSPRFGTDLSWTRTTTNPIAGTASASAPVPQGTTTNSSLGLDVFLASPSRISFLFAINCNQNNGDHLDFFVDGVLTAQLSTRVSNTLIGGKFITDALREGAHTFDWRFVRGGTASVAAEECKIDTVEIIPETAWLTDPARVGVFDDGWLTSQLGAIAAATQQQGIWVLTTGANAGTVAAPAAAASTSVGGVQLTTAVTAAGDNAVATMQAWGNAASANNFRAPNYFPLFEARVNLVNTASANAKYQVGFFSGTGPNAYQWVYDGSLGAASTLRWQSIINGAVTTADSGIASTAGWFRLGVIAASVRGTFTATFVKDGKALPGAASIPPLLPITDPSAFLVNFVPTVQVASVTAALSAVVVIDVARLLMARP